MIPKLQIPVQPSPQNCLAWSVDGELAIAAGEEVYLLIPQHGGSEAWTHVRITVSNFTTAEWPWQKPASFRDMSIGEEQARATVTALAWSPPGLAKHRRSVLAVLTSNLILSLWSSESNPTDPRTWERVLIVNKALSSASRLHQRIRTMEWAPINPQHIDRQTIFSRRKWGISLLAIADDSNGLYILQTSSPYAGQSFVWDVQVLCQKTIPAPDRSNQRPSLFALAMNTNHFIDRIEFGTWNGGIPITYRSSGIIHHSSVFVSEDLASQVPPKVAGRESVTASLDEVHPGETKVFSQLTVTPLIKAQIALEKAKFGREKNLGSHVMLKTWGLTSFNSAVAICISLHPAKMVEYIAPSDGAATILFDLGNDQDNAKSIFPWQHPVKTDIAKARQAILDTTTDLNLPKYLALDKLDLKIMYTAICGSLLLGNDKRLQAAVDILNLIERHASIDVFEEHRALMSVKNYHRLSKLGLVDTIEKMINARRRVESSSDTPEKALLDLCPLCPEVSRAIPFNSFTDACCPQRHPFGKLLILLSDSHVSYKLFSKVRYHFFAATGAGNHQALYELPT